MEMFQMSVSRTSLVQLKRGHFSHLKHSQKKVFIFDIQDDKF